jgi:hypothetical protein
LRRFTSRLVVAALAVVGGYFAAQMVATTQSSVPQAHRASSSMGASSDAATSSWVDGNALVDRVLMTLERRPNVAAHFRQWLQVGVEPLAGAGEYWQQGVGNTRRTCWQWKTMVAGEPATFCQILDKDHQLWTDSRLPSRRTVTYVKVSNVRRDLEAARALGQGGAGGDPQKLELLARGGLSQLIAELQRCFAFGPPVKATFEGRDVLAMIGRWRSEALARAWPSLQADAPNGWPAPLPHHVAVVVGDADFFPYVIEYRRGSDADLADGPGSQISDNPLARYEFHDVDFTATMREQLFEFPSTDVEWKDVTSEVVDRLRPASPVAAEQTAQRAGTWMR